MSFINAMVAATKRVEVSPAKLYALANEIHKTTQLNTEKTSIRTKSGKSGDE